MKHSNNLENKAPWGTYWRVQLVCKKVQAHSSLEPPLEGQTIRTRCLWQIKGHWDLFNHFGVTEILCSFRLVLEGKTGKEIPESSKVEFLEKFVAKNFALSDVEYNTSRPLSKGGIADLLLLRTLLAIRQKSQEPSFC